MGVGLRRNHAFVGGWILKAWGQLHAEAIDVQFVAVRVRIYCRKTADSEFEPQILDLHIDAGHPKDMVECILVLGRCFGSDGHPSETCEVRTEPIINSMLC